MGASGWVHINVAAIDKETEKAFLCMMEEPDEFVWIPKSQIADADNYSVGDEDLTLSVTEWIAKEKGLEAWES